MADQSSNPFPEQTVGSDASDPMPAAEPPAEEAPVSADAMAEESLGNAERAAADIRTATSEPIEETAADPNGGSGGFPPSAPPANWPHFVAAAGLGENGKAGLGLLDDINLTVTVELGRTRMFVEDVLRLNADAVVELDKAAGDPVDIYVNDRHVARGEVLVLNENFCVRISEIIKQPDLEE
jgi:flagellar motor switch protein FliN